MKLLKLLTKILFCLFFLQNVSLALPLSSRGRVDLVIFSRNRPLQLTALLESLEKHAIGLTTMTVLFHTDTDDFLDAYTLVQQNFPYVKFVMQEQHNRHAHFKRQLSEIIEQLNAPYLMFAVDDIVITDKIDVIHCCKMLELTGAYSCHLRVGKDITHSSKKQPMTLPSLQQVKGGMYTWFIHEAGGFDSYFGYPYSVDMTIFPRELVVNYVRRSQCVSPNTFEGYWNWSTPPLPKNTRGLCYPTSRMVNIELNLVQEGWSLGSPCQHTPEELLKMYKEGFRIDVDCLFQIPHQTCHINIPITWRKIS